MGRRRYALGHLVFESLLTTKVNQISDEGWDIGAITSDSQKLDLRDLELESRNLFGFCQARLDCVKKGGAKLVDGWVNFVTILQYSWENKAHLGNTLVGYFNQPFLANAGGVAIAGVISSNINERLQKKVATECSTSGSEADTISAAVAGALAANPSATQVSVTLNGPSGSWTITVVAAPAGETPKAEC